MRILPLAALAGGLAAPAQAAVIDVLWTAGSALYNDNITELAAEAATFDPLGDGANSWNLTLWDSVATPTLDFAGYDVLVVGSTYGVDQSFAGDGFFGLGVSAAGVIANSDAIAAARGSRTFLSGQDADWHDLNNLPDRDDGPKGFMIDAVNWAASGEGLGIVSMTDRYSAGAAGNLGWWTAEGSFLAEELGDAPFAFNSDLVALGTGQEDFPINEGLSTAGLSNWSTSSHAAFGEVDGYTPINFSGLASSGYAVTIVTTGEEGGGTDGPPPVSTVPLPAAGWLMVAALGGLGIGRRRARR